MNAHPPLIGLPVQNATSANTQFTLLRVYCDAIVLGGGVPVLIPLIEEQATLRPLYDRLDGLCLVGGGDIAPEFFNSAHPDLIANIDRPRDVVEQMLCRWALAEGKLLLAICRGIQMLNVAAGGTLYEDIGTLVPGALTHTTPAGLPPSHIMHNVAVEQDSLLARWLVDDARTVNLDRLPVNSRHHQAIRDRAPGLRVVARAPDGVIEAVEADGNGQACVLGVQWHPECMLPDHSAMVRLFQGFCSACANGGVLR